MQVADALDDKAVGDWAAAAAARMVAPSPQKRPAPTPAAPRPPPRLPMDEPPEDTLQAAEEARRIAHLRRLVSDRGPLPATISDTAAAALATLPTLLQQQVFRAAAKSTPGGVEGVLRITPRHLHAAVLQLRVSGDTKALQVFAEASPALLRALHALPASPPALLSLTISGGKRFHRDPDAPAQDPEEQATLLANAIAHHTALTALTLGNCPPVTLTTAAPAIGTLPRLSSITLGTLFDPFCYTSLPLLRPAFAGSGNLRELDANITAVPAVNPRKWALTADRSKPTPVCIAGLLSGAPSLTSIKIGQPDTLVEVTTDISLPQLGSLDMPGSWLATAAPLLSHLHAPTLTHLSLGAEHEETLVARAPDMPEVAQLCGGLARLTALRTLLIDLPEHEGCRRRRLWHGRIAEHLPLALAQLPHLEDVAISGDVRSVLRAVPAAAATGALRALGAVCRCSRRGYVRGAHGPPFPELWGGFMESLRLPGLRRLRLATERGDWAGPLPGVGAALAALPALTYLELANYRGCVATEEDVAAIGALTQLDALQLNRCEVAVAAQADLGRALGALRVLSELALVECGLTEAFAAPFAAALPGMRGLRRLYMVAARISTGVEAMIRGLAKIPQFERFSLQGMEMELVPGWGESDDDDDEDMGDYSYESDPEEDDEIGSLGSESERLRPVECLYTAEFASVHQALADELHVPFLATCL